MDSDAGSDKETADARAEKMKQGKIFGLALCLWSLQVTAQDGSAPDDPPAELEPISVTGSRVPVSRERAPVAVSGVNRTEIQDAQQLLGLDESLARIPGVFFQNRYNFAQDLRIAIRGFGAQANFGIRGIRLVADGIPQTLPDGQSGVDAIDLGSVASIEVIRGPFSAVHGASSGGVISLETERAPEDPFAALRLDAGAFGYRRAQLKGGGQWGGSNALWNLSSTHLDGYREHARYRNDALNAVLRHQASWGDLAVVFNAVDSPVAEDPGALTAAELAVDRRQAAPRNLRFDAGESLQQASLGSSLLRPAGADKAWRAHGFVVERDFDNRLPFDVNSNGQGGSVALDRSFYGAGVSYGIHPEARERQHRWVLGAEWNAQRDHRQRFANLDGVRGMRTTDQDEDVTALGVFVEERWKAAADWEWTLGLRYDEVEFRVNDRTGGGGSGSVTFSAWSPLLGVSWAWRPEVNVYANVARSFDTPTTTELANPTGATGFNQDLDEQRATNYELGVKGDWRPGWSYDLALFHIDVQDALVPFELAGSGQSFFRNAGRSTRDGVELSLRARWTAQWSGGISYTYSDFTFDRFSDADGTSFDGNRLPGVPRHLWVADLAWEPAEGARVALEWLRVGSFYADNANTVAAGDYGVLGLRGSWDIALGDWRLRPQVGIENLADTEYEDNVRLNAGFGRYFEPAPERNLHAGVTFRYDFGAR